MALFCPNGYVSARNPHFRMRQLHHLPPAHPVISLFDMILKCTIEQAGGHTI